MLIKQTVNSIAETQKRWSNKYTAAMSAFAANYEILANIESPLAGLEIEIRRFFWTEAPKPTTHKMDICYLSLAITPRPISMKVDYLGTQQQAFTAYGNCCFVPAGQSTRSLGAIGEYQEICCLFDPSLFEPHIDWQWTPLELAACFDIKNMHVQNLLLRLAEEASNPGYSSKNLAKATFQNLLIELSRHFRAIRTASSDSHGELSAYQLRLINEKISSSLDQDLHIDILAELCGVSGRHLSRMFKKTTGHTLGKYISHERINKAKFLLTQSNDLIKAIAFKSGFHSQSSFSQAFHDATGKTPSQFRGQAKILIKK